MKYVAEFASSPSLTHFCRTEFAAVAATYGVDLAAVDDAVGVGAGGWLNSAAMDTADPFFVFESNAGVEAVAAVASRCVLLRGLHVLLQAAPSLQALYTWRSAADGEKAAARGATAGVVVGEPEADFADDDYTYRVETVGKRYTADEKRDIIAAVVDSSPGLAGKQVNWAAPRRRFVVFVEHAAQRAPPGTQHWVPNGDTQRVLHVATVCAGGRAAILGKYDLKKRPYIGTTSMPSEESVLMSNLAAVVRGALVADPFCGTGSLLVAAAHCGGQTFGADADGRAMRAGTRKGAASPQLQHQRQLALSAYSAEDLAPLTPEERVLPSMRTNFKVYRLPPPDCARMNFSAWQAMWRRGCTIFDAIVTDPPYGLREPRKKAADTTAESSSSPSPSPSPCQEQYATGEVVLDLVLFAAEHLRVGGRLTFWLPTTDNYTDEELPTHPSLRVIHNLPQRLSLKFVRRLVTMEKIAEVPDPAPSREACAAKRSPDDLRALMDETTLPDNAEYTKYRERRMRRREAAQRHRAETGQEGGADDASGGDGQKGRGKAVRQTDIVANREKNIRIRQEKQAASHIANLAHKKDSSPQDGSEKTP